MEDNKNIPNSNDHNETENPNTKNTVESSQDFEDFVISPDGSTRKIELTTEPTSGPEPYNPKRYSNNSTYNTNTSNFNTGNGQPYQSSAPYQNQSSNPYTPPNNYQSPPKYNTPPKSNPYTQQKNQNQYYKNYSSGNKNSAPNGNYQPPGQNQGTNYYNQPPVNVNIQVNNGMMASPKSKIIMVVLCCLGFIGVAGVHRFYAGKIGTGILWFFTGGFCAIGTIVDLILILTDQFTDYYGYPIVNN